MGKSRVASWWRRQFQSTRKVSVGPGGGGGQDQKEARGGEWRRCTHHLEARKPGLVAVEGESSRDSRGLASFSWRTPGSLPARLPRFPGLFPNISTQLVSRARVPHPGRRVVSAPALVQRPGNRQINSFGLRDDFIWVGGGVILSFALARWFVCKLFQ